MTTKKPANPASACWVHLAAAACAAIVLFWAYGPAIRGEFLFDDTRLRFATAGAAFGIRAWLIGSRPVLEFSYWLNHQISGQDPFSFHVVNLLIHLVATALIFLIVRRLAEWSAIDESKRGILAGLAAAIFLLHPVQTEAVAYLAGRSESLSTMFALAAFAVFLYRKRRAATWLVAVEVLALFGVALLTKEQTVAIPAVFLLTDWWWDAEFSPRGALRNWRLYAAMAVAGAGGLALFWHNLFSVSSAGFAMKDFTWYQYFFTECRALFVYLGEFVLPINLTADWDFPISHSIADHGAIIGLAALVAMVVAAWMLRRRFRLAAYGFLVYLTMMAPTSSILPIQDPVAERRLYFSMLGLLLIVVDLVSRIKIDRKQLMYGAAAVALVLAVAAHARAEVWGDSFLLWQDTAQKSPHKQRARFQLAFAYYERQEYQKAVDEFAEAAKLGKVEDDLLVDWGLAYAGLRQTDQAIEKLRQAAAIAPTAHVYSQIGQVYGSAQRWPEALDALNLAEKLDSTYAMTFFYRGLVYYSTHECAKAVADYQRALALDSTIPDGNLALRQAAQCAGAR